MKVYCTVNTYSEQTPAGRTQLGDDFKIELSNNYHGFAEMKIGDIKFFVDIQELRDALECVNNEFEWRCRNYTA